jgi:hypothetical protein
VQQRLHDFRSGEFGTRGIPDCNMAPAAITLAPGPLADALKRGRQVFNARFVEFQRARARIDADAFTIHLATIIDPIIRAAAQDFSEKTDATAIALYELSLELFAENVLGPGSHERTITDLWRKLLPGIPRLVAREPRRIAASLTNAAHNLVQISGARPVEWIDEMIKVGPLCDDAQALLAAGLVAAWRAGCPQYRQAALQILRTMRAELLAQFFGVSPETPAPVIGQAIDAMSGNPWLDIHGALAGADPSRLRIVRVAGDFRGFGGPFLRPPIVAVEREQLIASDGTYVWAVIADLYGCVFHRLRAGNLKPKNQTGSATISAGGDIRWENAAASFPELANHGSAALEGATLAVTLPASHHVFLIARG